MRYFRISIFAGLLALGAPAQAQQMTAEQEAEVVNPISQSEYETGMTCIGRYDGVRSIQNRIADTVTDHPLGDAMRELRTKSAGVDELMEGIRANTAKPLHKLDQDAGYRAYRKARQRYSDAAVMPIGEQWAFIHGDQKISDECTVALSMIAAKAAYQEDIARTAK